MVMALKFNILIAVAACLVVSTSAHKDGAPRSVCTSLTPHHGSKYHPQPNSPPYLLVLSRNSLQGGAALTITLKSEFPDVSFKGFLVQARNENEEPVGEFTVLREFSDISQLLDCRNRGDSITHRRVEGHVSSVSFDWTPPRNFTGQVRFHWTVVKTTKKFWADIVSDPVTVE